ncbi:MAG: tRNA guanosine(34) transglycosylase Tgt, partial [Chitinispirillia bacterium]
MDKIFSFKLNHKDSKSDARAGTFITPHCVIETPVFMPVGTQATVKSLSPKELNDCGSSIILANTYHLHLRPGESLIKNAGGLHSFEGWNNALLTDSGGYQVFSLRDISSITDDGVWFQSHIDGSRRFFSPETVMEIQHFLGADIIMMFDECPPSKAEQKNIAKAVDRTINWAQRCVEKHLSTPFYFGFPQALFGIVQGGVVKPLREKCAIELLKLDLPGYAIGGLAVGESIEDMYEIVHFVSNLLPRNKPRYLMGVGLPQNILE